MPFLTTIYGIRLSTLTPEQRDALLKLRVEEFEECVDFLGPNLEYMALNEDFLDKEFAKYLQNMRNHIVDIACIDMSAVHHFPNLPLNLVKHTGLAAKLEEIDLFSALYIKAYLIILT